MIPAGAEGWSGRTIAGSSVKKGRLPRPGEAGYAGLLSGLARFRDAHSGAARKEAFLDKVLKK